MSFYLKKILAFSLVILISLTQYGFSFLGSQRPSKSVIKDAIGLQIHLAEGSLRQSLELNSEQGLEEVLSLNVDSIEFLDIPNRTIFVVKGYCDWGIPNKKEKILSYFKVLLEQGEMVESWRLALAIPKSIDSKEEFVTYPLPIKN